MSIAKRDVEGIAQLLIDSEMNAFRGLETPVIFLQNVATDFLLGLGYKEAFLDFRRPCQTKIQCGGGIYNDEFAALARRT